MIDIGCTSREMAADLFRAPGGFAWWYLDVLTPEGDGIVLIWSYGLPFLPGYAAGARRGTPELPSERPSVNLVVYRRGSPVFYLLQEHPGEGEPFEDGRVQRIGRSRFTSRIAEGRRRVEVELDCAVPGTRERLTGTIRMDGVARRVDGGSAPEPDHLWTPLTGPATAEVSLRFGGRPFAHIRGRAYHDRNGGCVPLHALGIRRWIWGRVPLPDRERIFYLLWPKGSGGPPRAIGLTIDGEGRTHRAADLRVEPGPHRRSFAGLRWPTTLTLSDGGQPWLRVRTVRVVDQGPFYLRFQSEGVADEVRALGWSELCEPDRVDLALHRPFVRMRVHRPGAPNSSWLPLFSGPRAGRPGRLLCHWLGRGG